MARDLVATLRKTIVLIIIISVVAIRIIRANLCIRIMAPLVILVSAARGRGSRLAGWLVGRLVNRRFITKGGGG